MERIKKLFAKLRSLLSKLRSLISAIFKRMRAFFVKHSLLTWRKILHTQFKIGNFFRYRLLRKLTLSSVGLLSLVVTTVLVLFYDSSWFGYYFRMPEDESALFYTIAGMVIAMLAIVLAFSTQLTARSSESLPTRYFWLFARDLLLDFYYVLIGLIAVVNLFFGLTINDLAGNTRVLYLKVGVVLAIWSIALLYASYRRLIQILSHEHLVKKITRKNKKEIDELSRLAQKMAQINSIGRSFNTQQRSTVVASMYNSLTNRIGGLNKEVEGLVELHDQHLRKDDRYAAGNFFSVATGLIIAYIWSRRESATLVPNREFPITPQSNLSDFLQENLETLKPVWNKALSTNDIPTIRSYMRGIQGIVRTTLYIKHIGDNHENPAYDTAYHHFKTLIDEAIETKNLDALFEAPSVLQQVAEVAIPQTYYSDAITGILSDLERIAQTTAVEEKLSSANYNLVRQLAIITVAVFREKEIEDRRLDKLTKTVSLVVSLAVLSPHRSIMTSSQVDSFAQNLLPNVMQDMNEVPTEDDIDKMIQVSKLILDVEKQMVSISRGDNPATEAFNICIEFIVHDLLKMRDGDSSSNRQRDDINNLLQDVVNIPRSFRPLNDLRSLNNIEDTVDRLIQAAITSLKNNDLELTKKIFDSLIAYLKTLNNTETNIDASKQAEVLRIINRTKLIGAIARKLRKIGLQRHVKDVIKAVEADYIARYFPGGRPSDFGNFPSYDALRPQPLDPMSSFGRSGMGGLFQDAYDVFYSEYTEEDFYDFDSYIWQD